MAACVIRKLDTDGILYQNAEIFDKNRRKYILLFMQKDSSGGPVYLRFGLLLEGSEVIL